MMWDMVIENTYYSTQFNAILFKEEKSFVAYATINIICHNSKRVIGRHVNTLLQSHKLNIQNVFYILFVFNDNNL